MVSKKSRIGSASSGLAGEEVTGRFGALKFLLAGPKKSFSRLKRRSMDWLKRARRTCQVNATTARMVPAEETVTGNQAGIAMLQS